MSNQTTSRVTRDAKRVNTKKSVLSPSEVKTRLREQGMTLKTWAKKHGYPYGTVSDVVRGQNKATFGMGHRIAVALGMK